MSTIKTVHSGLHHMREWLDVHKNLPHFTILRSRRSICDSVCTYVEAEQCHVCGCS